MPRPAKGPRLYLVPARKDKAGRTTRAARWVIRDGTRMLPTGCGADDAAGAHEAFAAHLRSAHRPTRGQRDLSEIPVADVLSIYATDIIAKNPDRSRIAKRLARLLAWWGDKSLADVTGRSCRAYAASRGSDGGARRDLQDLSAAIGHHHREGYHREDIKVALPKRGEARERWLSRSEVARLVWTAWRAREGGERDGVGRHTMRHIARFILLAYATASRPGAVLTASFHAAAGRSWIDLDSGLFYRRREGARETNKRQPPVRLPKQILAHLRRWHRLSGPDATGFVVQWRGQPVSRIKVGFARAVRTAGLGGGVSPHTLRHSAVTHMVQKGVPLWEAAGFAGMSEAILRKHYAHQHPDHMGKAVSVMGGGDRNQARRQIATD